MLNLLRKSSIQISVRDLSNEKSMIEFIFLDMDGSICLDILQQRWSASLDVSTLLVSIRSLLTDPNPASPANSEAAMLYQNHRRDYERRVREMIDQQLFEDDEKDENEDEKSARDKKLNSTTTTSSPPAANN